ncbi:AGAP007487-PA-like protein [Anopheles sinensis]|uniref:AGAP007487-PA-like protein n=1 Tax=Anopheles sinensis TaxID=74873 RepID=A0A084WNB3_ANOSI|nr:AGAP007487-PA-like protein [Anopheles sinensis]
MGRAGIYGVVLCLLAAGVQSQMVCYRCNDCSAYPLDAVICGPGSSGGGVGPTLPTSPAPTVATSTYPPWLTTYFPTLATVPPWPRAYGYLCYRVERYLPYEGRYVLDRGCALQLATYETTCNSVTGYQGYRNCQFCDSQLCNL